MPAATSGRALCNYATLAIAITTASFSARAQFDNSPSTAQPNNPIDEATSNPAQDHGASKILQGPLRALFRRPIPEGDTELGVFQTESAKSWPRLYRSGDLLLTGSLTGAVGLYSMSGNEFDKPAALATPGYKSHPNWDAIGPTLVSSAITCNPVFRRALIDARNIDRLNLGPVPTIQLNWLQPHEGNLIDFLFRARAFQTAGLTCRSSRS